MTVSRQDLEASLEKVRARTEDPRHGLFGPSSLVWRVNREQLLFLAGTRAVLLQEAHPFVAHGIDQHSRTKSDPLGRFGGKPRSSFSLNAASRSGSGSSWTARRHSKLASVCRPARQ
jgi:uncharacterized protein (DUF2236 family)